MAANRKVKAAYLGSPWFDFNNFNVYNGVFNMAELITLVFKVIVCQGHGQKVILKVKLAENVSSKGFLLSDTRFEWIF